MIWKGRKRVLLVIVMKTRWQFRILRPIEYFEELQGEQINIIELLLSIFFIITINN